MTCAAVTVNNLPVLFQANYDNFQEQMNIVYKFAVPPLKDLTTEAIRFILTRSSQQGGDLGGMNLF